ncbi:MAG: oxidoreductase [Promethearchaeota archaeon]
MKFVKLLESFSIAELEIRNRMVMPAMHLGGGNDGYVSDQVIEFYRRRAQGGVGFIIVGGIGVSSRGAGVPMMLYIDDDKYIPRLKELVDAVHAEGAKICAQLYHAGAYSFSHIIGEQAVSSSAMYSKFTHETPRALLTHEVGEVGDIIVAAGKRAAQAGFDAVEIVSSAGYLLDQFLSPLKNDRTDRYGGPNLEDRLTFPLELIKKMKVMKKEGGFQVIIGARFSGDDFVPGSNTYKEKKLIAQAYEQAGVQYLNVTGGWHETRVPQLPMDTPSGAFSYLAKEIKSMVSIPVFVSNRINKPKLGEQLLRDSYADAVCFGRPLIADPDLPLKIKNNILHEIRHCVGCNQGCFDGIFKLKTLQCAINPLAMHEIKYATPSISPKQYKILIIGAGPAGLEAARILHNNGHQVIVYEKESVIGGQLNVACVPPGREDIKYIIDYYQNQIDRLGIDLRMNITLTPEMVLAEKPDFVFCGTGVNFNIPNVPGFDGAEKHGVQVCFADEALAGDHLIGNNVVVIGGAATGVETALWAVKKGSMNPEVAKFLSFYGALDAEEAMSRTYKGDRKVTILEYLPKIGSSIGKSTKWVFLDELQKLGVEVITNVVISKLENNTVHYKSRDTQIAANEGEQQISGVDTFILATGVLSNRQFGEQLKTYAKEMKISPMPKIKYIGDAKKVGTYMDSIHSGFRTAFKLGKFR